jgi:hypothetical protein
MSLDIALQVAEETGLPLMAHIDEPPPSTRACSYLRKGGRASSGLLWLTTWVVTLSSVQWKRGSK